jgi:hypothetical protein
MKCSVSSEVITSVTRYQTEFEEGQNLKYMHAVFCSCFTEGQWKLRKRGEILYDGFINKQTDIIHKEQAAGLMRIFRECHMMYISQ